MSKHFRDYYWKNGSPQGIQAIPSEEVDKGVSYKIITDPYLKHISIEAYENGSFVKVIYDSQLLNFKKLQPEHQNAWERQMLQDGNECLIRDQDDRLILRERYTFKDQFCCLCDIFSPMGPLLAKQVIVYKCLGDTMNGVIFYDANDHAVMLKEYLIDQNNNFTELVKTIWSFAPHDKVEIPIKAYRSGCS